MARTKGPMMSIDASGTLAGVVTFSKWKGRNYVRKTVTPANPKSGLQTGMRAWLKFITQDWHLLSAAIQTNWKAVAKLNNITPLNAMIALNGDRARRNLGVKQDPTVAEGAVEAAPTAVTATAAPKSVNLAWVDSIGANDWCTLIYMSVTAGFTADISNCIGIVAKGAQKFTVKDLVTGTNYKFRIGGSEKGGTLGTLAAEVNATPT